ncbi:MAG: hypothetical protein ACOYLS_01285 [Polymorphobacter sp.]
MPVIRTYQQQVAPGVAVEQPRATPAAFGAGVAAAIGGFEDLAIERRDQARQREREDARAAAGVQLAQLSAASGETVTRLRSSAAAGGAGHKDAVLADFDKQAGAISAGITDRETARWAQVQIAQERARLQVQEGGWEAGARADKLVTDVTSAVDLDRATVYANPTKAGLRLAVERSLGVIDALSLPDASKVKLATEARTGLGLSFIQGLRERDPYKARDYLDSGALGGLIDPDKLQMLRNGVDSEIKGREAAARQEQRERERAARDAERDRRQAERDYREQVTDNVQALNDRLRDGGVVTAQEIRQATTAAVQAGNPELARTTANLGIKSLTVQSLKGQPPVAVQGYINDLSARISKAGANASTEDMIAREAASDYLNTAKRELANDPLSFAAREGVVAVAPLDPNNPASFAARVQAGKAAARRYGTPLRILTDEEAGAMSGRLSGTPAEAVAAVTALRAFGKEGAFAVARQIAPKDAAAAHMVGLSMIPGAGGMKNVADIQTGRELLRANPKVIDTRRADAVFAEAGLTQILKARPQLTGAISETSRALYASRWVRAGNSEWNDGAFMNAVNAALGGYRDASNTMRGGIGEWNNSKTILPSGVSQNEFEAAIGAIDDAALAKVPGGAPIDNRGRLVPANWIRRGQLVSIGDGRYEVEIDGTPVKRASGGNFVLAINQRGPTP